MKLGSLEIYNLAVDLSEEIWKVYNSLNNDLGS